MPPLLVAHGRAGAACVYAALLLALVAPAAAQPVPDSLAPGPSPVVPAPVPVSAALRGQAIMDYGYVLATPDSAGDGANGFDIRRVELRADVRLAERFTARVGLEANTASTNAQGRSAPYLRDAAVTWLGPIAPGHDLTFGITPPPSFVLAEETWGYRSIAATLMDRTGIVGSRDFGLRANGPLTGSLRYGLMVSNGNGFRAEEGVESGKRLYAQLEWRPGEAFRATLGVDRNALDGEDDSRASVLIVPAFAGFVTERARGGVEAFWRRVGFDADEAEATDGFGASVFGGYRLSSLLWAVVRADYVEASAGTFGDGQTFALAALDVRVDERVSLIPTILFTKPDGSPEEVAGRLTVFARF